jgi:hypothetical protein
MKIMAHCSPLSEITTTNATEVENLGGVESTAEVAQTIGGDEVPVAFGDYGRVLSMGRTDDSMGGGASDNKNSRTYNFRASTITLDHIKEMVEKGYFADGEARALGAEAVLEPNDNEAIVYDDFLLPI